MTILQMELGRGTIMLKINAESFFFNKEIYHDHGLKADGQEHHILQVFVEPLPITELPAQGYGKQSFSPIASAPWCFLHLQGTHDDAPFQPTSDFFAKSASTFCIRADLRRIGRIALSDNRPIS